jgi:hypothetical protein
VWRVIHHGLWSAHGLAAAVLTGGAAVTIYGLNADWARYHLPILLLTTICIGIATGQAWTTLQRQLQDRRAAAIDRNLATPNEDFVQLPVTASLGEPR